MAKLLYQGHGSFRLTTNNGSVAYLDPYVGEGYDKPADIILITHQHGDHNNTDLITQKPGCTVITNVEALSGGKHNTFSVLGMDIEAVMASNKNHPPEECVGFIIAVDNLKLYFSGDTSKTPQMSDFASRKFDYAFLCCDGFYNMGLDEASECAELIGARHNTPIHIKPGELFDRELAEQFKGPNRLIIEPGNEIDLL
ncbi:MAG: MBL fold metallo-hydrolase [Oscillospiraceae bacterium]|nr:MBL fold metallo-hydrolase [Oscillospiraceae bacterium]